MSLLPILRWPDPKLGNVCVEVEAVTPEIVKLGEDMLETMYAAPGRGLAAPQVGVLKRVFVMDATWKDANASPEVFINPEIVAHSQVQLVQSEGCLSIPGVAVDIARPDRVRVRWMGMSGATEERDFTGFACACVQHEIDHLDGIVTLDHLSPETRVTALEQYRVLSA